MQKKIKLHLGCYHKKIYGFINIDARGEVEPDIIDDALELKKIENETVDLVYASHLLEHFKREDSIKALKRWYEVLKPGGVLRLAVPDLEAAFGYYQKTKDLKILQNLIYGSQKHPYDFHYNGWDLFTLTNDLKSVGFESIRRYDWRETEHFFIDDYSQSYLPQISYKTRRPEGEIGGTLVSLNVEAIK
jgi:predicted SAM-dependent methyltransferase